MSVLNGFPMVDQRTAATTDGLPSENANDDCVAASICAACMYLNGIKRVGGIYTPDNFKDKADGQGYIGFTAATQYVNFCASLGVKLYSVDGDSSSLVQQAHQFLAQEKPVIFTQDDWVVDTSLDKYKGWTHVACWYADSPGALTSMDPWGGFPRMKSDAGWIPLLRDNQIWIAEPLHPAQSQGDLPMLQLSDPMGHFYTELAPDRWHCNLTGVDLAYAHLTFYREHQGIFGLIRTNEIYLKQYPNTAIVVFERSVNAYDPGRVFPNEAPPGAGSVYLMQIDGGATGIGQQLIAKPLLAALQAQVSQLQAELAAEKNNTALQAQLASYQAAVKQVDAIIHPLAIA